MQTFSTTATDSPKPLRQMLVPTRCIEEFLARAQANTAKDIETLATLLGVKERIRDVHGKRTVYRVTTVFIPQQEGKSDQCASTEAGDAELVEYVFKHGLKQLGWIHTHPSWGCFMSSVDLHNALGFQLDLPESISIVCSRIEDKANGIFRVTVPEGIEELLNCDRTGFHSHPDKLFEEVTDGSVVFVDGPLTVVDCRPSRK
ncbi:Mov34-domain-containing protein [Hymenopellis radicata]|nr:Mov34-domain-containing protein [Hymenopellis radicata]